MSTWGLKAAVLAAVTMGAAASAVEPSQVDIPSPLSLEKAVQISRERGLDILLAQTAIEAAQGDLSTAGAVPNPQASFSYGAYQWGGRCAGCQPPQWSVGLSDQNALEEVLSGKRGLRRDAATAALEAARASREDAQRNLLFAVKAQFVQALLAKLALGFAQETLQASTRLVELGQVRYRAGATSEADLARIQTAQLEAAQGVDAAGQAAVSAQAGLAFLLGARGPLKPLQLVDPDHARYALPHALDGATYGALLEVALAARPDLKAEGAAQARAEAALQLAHRLRVPDIALQAQYVQSGGDGFAPSSPPWTVGLSVTLPVFYQQQGEVQKASADQSAQALLLARLQAQVSSEVAAAFAAFDASRRQVVRMETGLLERSRRARDLVEIQYQKGAASLLEYLDAQRTFISVNLEYFQDVANYWTSVFKLEQATGTELP